MLVDLPGECYGELTIDDLVTASRPTLIVRVRPMHRVDGERGVHEALGGFLARLERGVLVALSRDVVDLIQGGRAAEPLLSLAGSAARHLA